MAPRLIKRVSLQVVSTTVPTKGAYQSGRPSDNKLTLNMTKTEFTLILSRQKLSQFMESPSLTIKENAVEQVTSAKSLGVYADRNINWECHIEKHLH